MYRRDEAQAGAIRVARGCWVAPEWTTDLDAMCRAALETYRDDGLIALTTAARVHELWLPTWIDAGIYVATATSGLAAKQMTRTTRPEFVAQRRRIAAEDRTVIRGLPVLTAARTWVDLGAVLQLPDLVAAGDSVLRSGTSVEELASCVERSRRMRGVRVARQALPLLDRRSRSHPESHLRVAVHTSGLPWFEVNEPVYREDGGWLAEPDLSLKEAKLALEYQGADHAELVRMRKDITRDTDMRREGWRTIEYGPAQVYSRPWEIAPDLRQLIAERAPHLLRRAS